MDSFSANPLGSLGECCSKMDSLSADPLSPMDSFSADYNLKRELLGSSKHFRSLGDPKYKTQLDVSSLNSILSLYHSKGVTLCQSPQAHQSLAANRSPSSLT
jgi:hypothetical protein